MVGTFCNSTQIVSLGARSLTRGEASDGSRSNKRSIFGDVGERNGAHIVGCCHSLLLDALSIAHEGQLLGLSLRLLNEFKSLFHCVYDWSVVNFVLSFDYPLRV